MPRGRECRIRFERPVWGKDELGTRVATGWSLIAEVWGWRRTLREDQREQGAQEVRVVTDLFQVRWRPLLASLTSEDQMVVEGLTYGVVGARELDLIRETPGAVGRGSRREWLEVSGVAKPDAAV